MYFLHNHMHLVLEVLSRCSFLPNLSSHEFRRYTDCSSLVSRKQGCGQRFPCKDEMSVGQDEKFKA